MAIRFSEKAIKSSFLVENPGWYVFKCTDVKKKLASNGESNNYFYIFEGEYSPNAENPREMESVPVTYLANEKADWLHYPIFKALNNGNDLSADSEVNPEDVKGATLEAYCKRGARQDGTPQNSLVEFRPFRKE